MRLRELIEKLRNLIDKRVSIPAAAEPNPEPPEDPYSYVTAPKKPQLPGLTAAAVAERPNE